MAKFKTPEEFVISAYRAFGHVPPDTRSLAGVLTKLGQRPMSPGSPAGWPDTAAHWDGGDALLKRIEWADAIGRAVVGDSVEPARVARAALGPLAGQAT